MEEYVTNHDQNKQTKKPVTTGYYVFFNYNKLIVGCIRYKLLKSNKYNYYNI